MAERAPGCILGLCHHVPTSHRERSMGTVLPFEAAARVRLSPSSAIRWLLTQLPSCSPLISRSHTWAGQGVLHCWRNSWAPHCHPSLGELHGACTPHCFIGVPAMLCHSSALCCVCLELLSPSAGQLCFRPWIDSHYLGAWPGAPLVLQGYKKELTLGVLEGGCWGCWLCGWRSAVLG